MQKRLLAVFCVVLAANLATAQTGPKDEVLKVEAAFNQAKLDNDVAALDRILADDYIGINQWGGKRDKRAALELFRTYRTASLVPSGVSVRVSGDTATVDGIMYESNQWRFLFLRTYVKRQGRWQLLSMAQPFPVDPQTMRVTDQGSQPAHPVTGRPYATVMGAGGADWLVRPEREHEEEPDKALAALRIAKGSTVADIGAGVGYFTWRLADVVGPKGKVYANDIQPEMIKLLQKNIQDRSLTNVEPVLGKVDDPKLPKGAIDLALLVDVYHEFSEPQKMLDRIRESLKPDGRLVLLEYRKEDPKVPIRGEHKMSVAEVEAEVEPEGYKLDKVLEILPRQHILIFRVRVM
jgi:SAM-dependent methyltransferase